MTAAKTSWVSLKVGPGLEVVKEGRTKLRTLRDAMAAKAGTAPSGLKVENFSRKDLITIEAPKIAPVVIMIAAKTVSLARFCVLSGFSITRTIIIPTSMIVTAAARISEPKGSPTLRAITSA